MSISYHGIIGNKAKTTMGSAEGWYKNKNILRDPPKSITTRRVDKVNQDGSLNAMMYHTGDRIAENINVFARGVNPMVSVEYSNHASTMRSVGGGADKGLGAFGNGAPGKLPYRIIDAGAFRPPMLRQEQLLPLSRQPRNITHVITNKEFIDYTKTVTCQSEKCPSSYRQIKEGFKSHIEPTKTCKIASPVQEHFVLKYVVQNPNTTSATTAKVSKANIQMINRESLREAGKTINQYAQNTAMKSEGGVNYIHEDVMLDRNIPSYMATTNAQGDHLLSLEHENDFVLQRNIPEYSAQSNASDRTKFVYERPENNYEFEQKTRAHSVQPNIRGQADVEQNRTYNLRESLHAGGFEGKSTMPLTERMMNYNSNYVTGKTDIARRMRDSR